MEKSFIKIIIGINKKNIKHLWLKKNDSNFSVFYIKSNPKMKIQIKRDLSKHLF